jgi:glycine cleavage system H protein
MNIPENLKYTKNHEWLLIDGKNVKIGITEFAQSELGEIVFVELPEVDDDIDKEDSFCVVESTKAASDVYAPVSGKVLTINEDLEDAPETINEDPYEKGWLCTLALSNESELEDLLTPADYKKIIKE